MTSTWCHWMSLAAAVILSAGVARADIVTLTGGRTLEGNVVEADDPGKIKIEFRYGSLTVSKDEVVQIIEAKTFEEEVEETLARLDAEDVEGHFELARKCAEKGWTVMARDLYRHVLALDPGHFQAREALGYVLVDGDWKTEDEIMTEQGYIKWNGRWVHPDEVRAQMASNHWQKLQKKVDVLVKRMGSSSLEKRERAYEDLVGLESQIPGIASAADVVRDYWERVLRARAAQGEVVAEIRATTAQLQRPIDTFETSLATGSVFDIARIVSIQIPEMNVTKVRTTVAVPVIWNDPDREDE